MRLAKLENYSNATSIEHRQIRDFPTAKAYTMIISEKDKIKVVKKIEQIARSSMEYKQYIEYLRKYIDMTKCSFFNNISNKDSKRVSIEIHHEPFTLFDIAHIILEKWIATGQEINPTLIAEEMMKLHYQNKVGLIPLSITVHQLVHTGKLFVPLQCLYGDFVSFFEEYEPYVPQDLKDILEIKLKMSKDVENEQDLSILERKYTYLEVDGFNLPQQLDEIVTKY